ncbi:MAG: hypothetical protein SGJ05_10935 [bacterium]|nr:hypothetical protein [bacterium]
MKVIRSIETDNTRIHEDFVDAILQVSPKWAAQWAAKEVLWIEQQSYLYFLYPTKIGALIQRLAENGHANAALALARAILDMPHRETFVAFGRARIETWAYEKILTERIPFLVRKSGAPSLTMLCNTFETTLHTSYTLGTSYFWRATIAAHEMNFSDKSMRHALVDAIRASAIDMMWEGKGQDMVDLLFQRGPALYRRVAFHAVVAVPKLEANLEASLVMNEATFQDDTNYPEYGLLLRQTFPKLNPSQQAVVLSWIADGPLTNEADSLAVDVTGERHERWQHQRLWCIKDSLTGELSAALSDLNEKYGEPVDRVERPTSRGYEVDVSPISLEDLSKMSPADVANFLLEWVPSGERYSPSVKGLANELERAVARSPQPYADALSRFVGVRSRYTCAIINGFQEARRKQPTFNAVIALGFLSQQVTSARSEEQQTINEDDKWYCVWSRIQVGQLIATLLDDNRVEFADRDQVWTLITQLIEDEHPTSGDDESSANGEAIHNSWNCVRGSAMHAVLPYANWVRQNMLRTEPQTWQADLGLGQMQEVQLLLERLLDTSIEPSPSVRAVYGYALAFFNIVDTGWVTEHLNTIFSDDDASLHEAAWRAYLGSPFRRSGAFRLTRALYVSTLDNTTNYSGYTERVTEQLGLDIMMAFANGIVDFNDTDQIIERYFSSVPAEHIAHAITKMGNLLSGEENVPVDIATRYERLWSYYNQRVGPSLEANAVAQTFDPWFSCPHLNANWAFHEMRGLLSRSPTDFGRLHSTMGRLAQLAPTFPAECLSILENIATCDVQGWAVFGAREEIRTIIKAGLSVEATRQIAIRVVHVLGALGEEHLGDLLENTDSLIVL